MTIRLILPAHLRILSRTSDEVLLDVSPPVTRASVLDALELAYPMLRGTTRDQTTGERRAFLRFFACEQDLTHEPADAELPKSVLEGIEPYIILGAIAGG